MQTILYVNQKICNQFKNHTINIIELLGNSIDPSMILDFSDFVKIEINIDK